MNLYKLLNCLCEHEFVSHIPECKVCECRDYDANGRNPELENFLCPRCRLIRMERNEAIYYCMICGFVISESEVMEMFG